jgi:hypothetical protein
MIKSVVCLSRAQRRTWAIVLRCFSVVGRAPVVAKFRVHVRLVDKSGGVPTAF